MESELLPGDVVEVSPPGSAVQSGDGVANSKDGVSQILNGSTKISMN
jgi:hypothetical protein